MSTKLVRIAEKAKENRTLRFNNLAHLINPEFLMETWKKMNQKGASGVDGESMEEYGKDLEKRVKDLCERLRSNRYKAPPVRRVYIPKPGKSDEKRPLGIPTVEGRLLQRAVARILEAVYEQDFLDCSYGFRPGRNPHHALKKLRDTIVTKKVMYILEADIRGYFNHINHEWLRKMIAHRIADPVILRLVGKWLNAGVMENGIVMQMEKGSPQGGPISPLLSNVYLHYVLDLWFEKTYRKLCKGETCLVRFADDYVVCFQHRQDADDFHQRLKQRLERFGLELAAEKTRILLFGRFARERKANSGGKPETFDFLGFTHVCGTDRQGKFAVVRIPSKKSCRKFLDKVHEWLTKHIHWQRRDRQKELRARLQGFYHYFALHHCNPKLDWIRGQVELQWIRVLRRQSQRHRLFWCYLKSRAWFELPYAPETIHATV
jgi:RNA-directed DNA polymerase